MALPNITSYAKNVAKSIVYTAVDVVKEDMPTLAAYVDQDSNRELTRSIYAGVKDYKGTIKKAQTAIKSSKIYEAAELATKSAFEDIRSGKFYNKERIDAIDEKAAEAMFGSFEDMDLDFNFDDGDDGPSEITSGDKLVAASTQVAAYKAADMVAQTQIKSTNALIKAQKASTQQLFLQSAQIIGGLKEVAFVGAQSQGALVNLTGIQENAARNSKLFYENTSKLLQESNAMMKEMLEMQRAIYKSAQQQERDSSKKRIGYSDVVDYDGVIDLKSYMSNIKANAKSALGEKTMGMSDFLGDMSGDTLKMLASSPLKFISEGMLRALIPAATKGAAKNLDKTLSGISSTLLARFNNMAKDSDNPVAQLIGQIFGIKTTPKTSLDTSKFNKGPVPFDGVVRKSIVDVIPTYLRRIEAAITGQPEKIYDMAKGSWTDVRKVKAEYDRMIKGARAEANYDLVEEIQRVLNDKKAPKFQDKYSRDAFNNSLETFLNALYDRDGDFKFKSKEDAWKYGISEDDFAIIADILTNKNNKSMQRARIRHAGSVMSSKSSLNSRFEQMEQLADSPLFQLFNGSTPSKNFETPSKYEESPRAFGGALDINNQKDNLGNNIFFYLRNMYNELYTLRNYTGVPTIQAVGGGTGRLFSQPSIRPLQIPDNHTRTAKEEYETREAEARRRYDEEIARHTREGGKLYDLVDTRGNIMRNRATVEQREILDQLEASRQSYGWLNDMLYGDDTQLNSANRKRREEGQDPISAKRFIDRMKATKNLSEKFAVMQDQINKITKTPANMAKDLIEKADARIYSFFYGEETGEEDENGNKIRGFMQLMSMKMNDVFDKVNNFIDTKILDPIKKKLGIENAKDLMDKMGVTDIWNNISNRLFGEKDADGKRHGGIFGDTREEIKRVFGTAKDYVFDSIKEIFSPITTRVQSAIANRPKVFKKEVTPDQLNNNILATLSPNTTPLNALYKVNPQEAITRLKKEISESLKSHNLPCSDLVLECASKADTDHVYKQVSSVAARLSGPDADAIRKNIDSKFKRLSMFFSGVEAKRTAGKTLSDIANANKQSYNATQNLINGTSKPGDNYKNHTRALNKRENDQNAPILQFCKEIGVNPNSKEGALIANKIRQLVEEDPNYDPKHPWRSLNNISMVDVHAAIESANMIEQAKTIKKKMMDKYNNQDVNLNTFLTGDRAGGPIPTTGGNIISKAHETLEKILSVIKSVTTGDSVVVELKRKTRPPRSNSGTPRILSHVTGGRESETEGDSTGDSDGELHSSAFGNSFKNNAISALSEGELYSRNGLVGKVPSTGVYDIKSGTTIYPTKKDKAIELAKEQSAISKFLSKTGIPTNAEANSAPTKQYQGKVYRLGDDGKYHHYEIVDGKTYDNVLEDGFMDQMYSTAKGGLSTFLSSLGFKGLAESNTTDSVDKAMDVVKKYAPKMTAHGLLGAAVGLLSGNPLLGAAIGATSGYVSASEKAKIALFGEEVKDADGNKSRSGGMISKSAQDTMKKYLPNMGKYGTTGAVLGLLTPFGLVGGALIGSAVGWATTDDKIKEALFGNLKDSKSGLITKEFRDNVKKAAPNIAIGAIGGLLAGPFGLMGNLVLGSGIGLASSTDGFQKFLFGEEDENGNRKGGLAGAIKLNVVDPLKDFAFSFKEKAEDFVINDMINPLKEGIKPITHEMALLTKGLIGFVPKMLNKMFESTFGRPLQDLIRDRIIAPAAAAAGFAGRVTGGIGKAVISAPFKAFGAVGRGFESKHIRKGDANYISAAERLAFRDENRGRGILSNIPLVGNSVFGSLGMNPLGYRDKFRDVDETLASMQDPESLKAAMDAVETLAKGKNHFKEQNRKTGRGFMAELSAVFPSSVCGRVKKALERNDLDTVANLIRSSNPIKGVELTPQQREVLIKKAGDALTTIEENNRKSNLTDVERSNLFGQLNDMGFSNIGENNINKLYDLIKTEYGVKKNNTVDGKTEEEKAAEEDAKRVSDPIIENATENTDRIVNALTESLRRIEEIQLASLPESEQRKVLDKMSAKQDEIAKRNLKDVNEDETMSNDGKVKWQFDSASKSFRKYVMTSDGWEEAPGKAKADADKAEEEKEQRQSRSFASGIGSSLLRLFTPGGVDKDTGEKKDNPIVSLFKKAAKVAGIGLLGTTAIAATGHASEFMKTTGLPFIRSLWDERMKPFLTEHLGAFGEKVAAIPGKLWEKVVGIKNWIFDTANGLPKLFRETIFPWYEQGLEQFGNNILMPATAWLVRNSGTIISGLLKGIVVPMAKGIWQGIKDIFVRKDKSTYEDPKGINSKVSLTSIPKLKIGETPSTSDSFEFEPVVFGDSKYTGATEEQVENAKSLQEQYDSAKTGAEKAQILTEAAKNADISASGVVLRDSTGMAHDAKYNTNLMIKDAIGNTILGDGTVTNDNQSSALDMYDGTRSVQDRLVGAAGRKFLGVKGLSGVTKAVTGLAGGGLDLIGKGARRFLAPAAAVIPGIGPFGSAISYGSGAITSLAGKATKRAGQAIGSDAPFTIGQLGGRLGAAGAKLQSATLGSAIGDVGAFLFNHSKNPDGIISKLGEKLATSNIAQKGAAAQAHNIAELAAKGTIKDNLKALPGKMASGLVDKAKSSKIGGLISKASDGIKKLGGKAAASAAEELAEGGVKEVAENVAKEGIEKAAEGASKGLIGKVKDFILKNAQKFFGDSKVIGYVRDAMSAYGKKVSQEAAEKAVKEVGEKVAKSFVEKVTEKLARAATAAVAKVSSIIASAGLMTVVFAVADFIDGAMHAENTFGFVKQKKGQEGIEIGFFERVIAGLMRTANGLFTFGLVPEDLVVQIFVDWIAPLFNIDTSEFKEKQERSKQIIAEYNAAHGTDYDDVSSFNSKDSWYNKYIRPTANNIKSGATKAAKATGEVLKDVGSSAWSGLKSAGSGIANAFGFGSSNTTKYGTGRFYQNDPSIAWMPFNKANDTIRQTIGDSGCAPVAAANAVNYAYGTGADPISASKLALGYKEKNGGTNPKFFEDYFSRNGLGSDKLHGQGSILNSIKSGNPVVLMGKDSYADSNSPYGPNPHYVVGKGLDRNGNIIVDDPESITGSRAFPANKVLGKSSVAIAASKYGKGLGDYSLTAIYWPSGSMTPVNPNLTISKNDIYNSQSEAGEECCRVMVYQGLFGSSTVGAHSEKYMKVSTLARIGYSMNDSRKATSSSSSTVVSTSTSNASAGKPTQAEKNKIAFSTIGWWDKPYEAMVMKGSGTESSMINSVCKKYSIMIYPQDLKKTVSGIITKYFGCSTSAIKQFAEQIGPYVDLSLKELKEQNASLYSKLNGYSTVNGNSLNSYNADTVSVGSVCNSLGLIFDGDSKPQQSYASTESVSANQSTDSASSDMFGDPSYSASSETPEDKPTSIFDAISRFFTSLFDYTDKDGNKKNLLNIFGIGSGASSSSNSYSSNGTSQATGVQGAMANGFPYFSQSDPAWADKPYGGGTMASSACGPTSMAMVLKSYGADIDPVKAAEYSVKNGFRTKNQGTSWGYFNNIGGKYGLSTSQSGSDANTITSNLKKGYPIISSMKPGDFTKGGHFIVLSGIDNNGQILVNDPAGSKGMERSAKPWSPQTIASQAKQLWVFNKGGVGSIGSLANNLSSTSVTAGSPDQNRRTVWSFLKSKGYSDIAAAAILGNMEQESGVDPSKLQQSMHMSGPNDPGGFGLVQWTSQGRKDGMFALAKSRNKPWNDLGTQLDYFWQEVNSGYKSVLPGSLNQYTDIAAATERFERVYEGAGNPQMQNRIKYANDHYTTFAKSNTAMASNYGTGKYGMASNLGITRNGQITSGFNDPTRLSHKGIDIAGKAGQSIISPARGTIIRSEYNDTNGNMVVIQSEDGYLYTFCHMSSRSVKVGDQVSIGSLLGKMGDTGNSFGNHVHYQVTNSDGQYVDPLSIANGKRASTQVAQQPQRAIGGSDGIDYTQLIKIIIELLGTISDNTSNFTKALKIVSEKTGADLSGVDISSKDKALAQIQSKLRALDSSNGRSKSDMGSSLMGSDTDYLVKAMTAIAQS